MAETLMYGTSPLGIVGGTADSITFNNTGTGLVADDVQEAIEEVIDDFKYGTIASLSPTTNETVSSLINRLRTTYFDNNTPFCQLKLTVDGTSNLIFTCKRWTNTSTSVWETVKPISDSSMTTILISMSSTTVNVRKFETSSSGVTGSNISTEVASSDVLIIGKKF